MKKEWHVQGWSPGDQELYRSSGSLTQDESDEDGDWSCVRGNHRWPCLPICVLQLLFLPTQHLGCLSCNLPTPPPTTRHVHFLPGATCSPLDWRDLDGITNHTSSSPWWQGEPCCGSDHRGWHSYGRGDWSKMSLCVSPYPVRVLPGDL